MPTQYADGAFATAQPNGPPAIEYPLANEDPSAYIVRQPMLQQRSAYTGPPLGQPHPHASYAAALCVADESPAALGPLIAYERRFATIPASQDVRDVQEVLYRAHLFTADPPTPDPSIEVIGGVVRQRWGRWEPRLTAKPLVVPVRIHREYFLVGAGPESRYQSLEEVPIEPEFQPYLLTSSLPLDQLHGEAADRVPSQVTYREWIRDGIEICVRRTQLHRYAGPIWRAETIYAAAR